SSRARRPRPQGLCQGTRARRVRRARINRRSPHRRPPRWCRARGRPPRRPRRPPVAVAPVLRHPDPLPVVQWIGSVAALSVVHLAPTSSIRLRREPAPAVRLDVVDLAPLSRYITPRWVRAMTISDLDRPSQRAGEEAPPHTDLHDPRRP